MNNLNELLNNYLAGNHEDVRLALKTTPNTVSQLLELYMEEHNPDSYSVFLFVRRLTDN